MITLYQDVLWTSGTLTNCYELYIISKIFILIKNIYPYEYNLGKVKTSLFI